MAFHKGVLEREFCSGMLDKNLMENVNKTYFVMNVDNGHIIGFRRDCMVKYVDIVAEELGIIMVIKVIRGVVACIETPYRFSKIQFVPTLSTVCLMMSQKWLIALRKIDL